MAIDNLISVEFTDQELTRLGNALNEIAQLLSGKVINLTPEERKQYGSIGDKNKIFVDKCKAYMEQNIDTLPKTIDKHEFDKDYKARQQIEEPLRKLLQLAEMLSDTKILLDFDNYNGSISLPLCKIPRYAEHTGDYQHLCRPEPAFPEHGKED